MTQMLYYAGCFFLSLFLTILYVILWQKQFQVHMSLIFLVIPIVNLGYLLMYATNEPEAATSLLKMIYIGGCMLPWLVTMCELRLCRIEVSRLFKIGSLIMSTLVYLSVLSIGYLPLYYQSFSLERVGDVWVQQKVYGPLHLIHYFVIIVYFLIDVIAIVDSYRKRKQVSRRILLLLMIPVVVTVIGYLLNRRMLPTGFEPMPLTYALGQIDYLLIARRMAYYNVSEMVVESMVQSGETGFITVDLRGRYLGSNETARRILPELDELRIDQPVQSDEKLRETLTDWLTRYHEAPAECGKMLYSPGGEESIYVVTVSDLFDGNNRCGYQVFLQDDTQNQKYIRLLDRYNGDLQAEVAAKTERLVAMHDRLILGMAAMVESRDNSTGGHIRRTSEGVRILIEGLRAQGDLTLTDAFCRNLVKAAPMHDLGKIAVDDAILRKPGRFTPEEYEMMKTHPAEGARIVRTILKDTEDEDFRRIAENVAHYHHERVDGSGYPDGLRGDGIPLEARIMAIADVYDALVSKRVYKDPFSFAQADQIIREGMGTQFDPALEPGYVAARPALETYYTAEMKS